MTAQLAFDFSIEAPEDHGFTEMQTSESGGHCSRCVRTLKGRYGMCHGAARDGLWFAWCDDCTNSKRTA